MLKLICPNVEIFDNSVTQRYKKYFQCRFYKNLSQTKFNHLANNYDIILLRFTHFLELKKNSKIKYVLSPTTGLTHIDKKIIKSKNIKIFNLNNRNFLKKIKASSEYTLYLILATLRKIKSINQKNVIGKELNGKLVGIIGLGRIGYNVAKFCTSLGARVIFYDKKIQKFEKKKIKRKSINFVLKKSDLIIICIPSTNKNYRFLKKERISLVKKGAILINTSRGEIIDEKFVIKLAKKKIFILFF